MTEINADRDLETLVQRIADTIQRSLGFRLVLVRLREPGSRDSSRWRSRASEPPRA